MYLVMTRPGGLEEGIQSRWGLVAFAYCKHFGP